MASLDAPHMALSNLDEADDQTKLASDQPEFVGASGNPGLVILLCVFSSLGGILFGYDTGINGGVQVCDSFISDLCVGTFDHGGGDCWADKAQDQPTAWIHQKGYFVALLSAGAMCGSLIGGYITEHRGRRFTIMVGAAVFIAATGYIIALSWMPPILVGRFVLGIPVGMLSFVLPMYAAEVAPSHLRGRLGSLMQLSIVTGILIATVVAVPVQSRPHGWREALGLCAVPAAVLVCGIYLFPESPRWLCKYKGPEAAAAALRRLRGTGDVECEVSEIAAALEAEAGASGGWKELLAPETKPRLVVAVGLQVLQQATGVNSIFYFAPTIFADVGVQDPLIGGLICGVANLFGTVLGIYLVDLKGRRSLLLVGAAGMAVGMLSSSLLLVSVDMRAHPWGGHLVILALCVFVVFFALSWGPICWLYPAEIFPMKVKVKAISLSTLANWVMNVAVADTVPILLKALSAPGLFAIFGVCGVGCFAFVFFCVPETKGKSLEEIDRMFLGMTGPRAVSEQDEEALEEMEHSKLQGSPANAFD